MTFSKKIPLSSKKNLKRTLPVNFDEKDIILFNHELNKEIIDSYVYKLNFVLLVRDTILTFPFFCFYPAETHLNGSFSSEQIKLYKKELSLPLSFYKKGIWITQNWTWMYFHWITDALTRYVSISNSVHNHTVLLPVEYKSHAYISESLQFLGIPFVWYNTSKTSFVKELLLPSHTSTPGNYNPDYIKKLRCLFHSKLMDVSPDKKIYISRKKAACRKLSNEDEFLYLLESFGVEVHYMEDYSFTVQVQLIFESSHVIGVHGGGLTNILFLQNNSRVFEIRMSGDTKNNCYFSLASALNNPYYYSQAEIVDEDELILHIDLESTRQKLISFFYE